ncbi:MAG: hypothetical protein LQ338_003380 [Usnochroma carphineum]|nr:MAG: hypothetical protein LQ338_003380 [Usnochroma carphineum]
MAQALVQAAPLKPDIRLAQALDDYEKILSDEERKQLHAQGAPDAMAAINFTTVIDRECNSRRRHSYTRLFGQSLVPFEKEFGPYEREIARLCQEVQAEASLASKQAQKEESELQARERSEAGKHRKLLVQLKDSVHQSKKEEKDLRMEIDRRKLRKRKQQTLDTLSTYDYQRTYKQIRKQCVPGTSNWILENPEFKMWKEGPSKGLWCSGKLSPKDAASFFFCRFGDQESLEARTVIGSLARQLVSDVPEDAFRGFSHKTPIEHFLKSTLSDTRQYFVILDGLDECDEAQIREVADILHSLLSSPLHFKIFWCSRPNVVNWLPPKFQPQQQVSLDSDESQDRIASDIGRFVEVTLVEWLEGDTPDLQISDPNLVVTIVERLEKEAQGMFLWVKLQLHTLREKKSDQQILDALDRLPRNLPQTFERILAKFTEAEDIEIGSQIFRWAAVAKRPLTTQELREAIGIEPL